MYITGASLNTAYAIKIILQNVELSRKSVHTFGSCMLMVYNAARWS
jgi:hypothetical protein